MDLCKDCIDSGMLLLVVYETGWWTVFPGLKSCEQSSKKLLLGEPGISSTSRGPVGLQVQNAGVQDNGPK